MRSTSHSSGQSREGRPRQIGKAATWFHGHDVTEPSRHGWCPRCQRTVINQGSVSLKQRPLTLDTLDSLQLIPSHCHRSLVGSVEVYYRSSDSVASDCDSNCDATAAESFRARAPGYSAAPRRARGMNPTMELERAITPISLSQWTVFECRSAGVAAPEDSRRGNCPLTWTCTLWRNASV